MNPSNGFVLNPLARLLRRTSIASFFLISPSYAFSADFTQIVDNREATVTSNSPVNNWVVRNNGTLNANNARTGFVTATGSTLNFTGTFVDGTGAPEAMGINESSTATLAGVTISGAERGLVLFLRDGDPANGNDVTVTNSTISGTSRAVSTSGYNVLKISGSTLSGTGQNGVGLEDFGSTVTVTGSQISGVQNGVLLRWAGPGYRAHSLTLDGTIVTGQTGPAIWARGSGSGVDPSVINVLNGSTLTGGNGVMVDVDNTNVAMNVGNSELSGNLLVRNGGQAAFAFDQARMTGDVIAEAGSNASVTLANSSVLTGRLENVGNLAVNSAAQWVMVEDSSVANLTMAGGAIKMGAPDAFYRLSVENLSGNGTFLMDADFSQGKVDFLDVTGTATGSHSLLVGATGADPVADSSLHVVHTAAGDAQFSLLNGPVDMGTYTYELSQSGNDWYLVNSGKVTPGASAVLALFNTAPTVWYGELSTLRSRMGELRISGAQPGGWIRAYGNKFDAKAASGVGYQQTQQGLSFGADAPLPSGDGQWLVGLLGGYSKSDLDLGRGTSGKVNSYYLGAYTTWLDQNTGYYFDGVLKFNRFRNEADVSMSDGTESKGDYDNYGVGASAEFGKHIKLGDDYFLEPYAQLSGVVIQGKDYALDNGMQAEGDRTRSLLGKLGTTAGRNFDLGEGTVAQPYVRAAYVHEFAKNNDVEVNNNVFNNDLSGSRGELGAGIAVSMSDRLQLHADFEYSNGDKLEQPWGANVGLRYSW